jgi:hypothetical protein
VAGDVIDYSDLPVDSTASYEGKAIADVANNLDGHGWVTYTAKGDMVMTWDFGRARATLRSAISIRAVGPLGVLDCLR